MRDFQSLLIANRGEIALRVLRTAQELGLRTVAVYSDADEKAPFVRCADEAVRIGPPPATQSYLVIDKILDAARLTGSEAVHPGYGFLSENAEFAKACEEAGLVFVGPTSQAIETMGDKARAKRAVLAAGVPCVPGYQGEDQADATLAAAARDIGFPVMIKASAGGGGRGMRLVQSSEELDAALSLAREEAKNAFGSGDLIIEKAVVRPRHIEIQILADAHGTIVHLGERDCSVQRRHQKIIEEAPSSAMTEDLRAEMGEAAIEVARSVDYVGAGTVEFLLDGDGRFYFLEMNTRLQVEHPVTEEITGLDLVAKQISVARGEPLGLDQADITRSGHAIEVRLYTEDPSKEFLPSTGKILSWQAPKGAGVRVDAGIETGSEITPFYDPMAAKIIAHGDTRQEARRRLVKALETTALLGPVTNRDFLLDALEQPAFVDGSATTAFIAETYGAAIALPEADALKDLAPGIALLYLSQRGAACDHALGVNEDLLGWSSTSDLETVLDLEFEGSVFSTVVRPCADGLEIQAFEGSVEVEILDFSNSRARFAVGGDRVEVSWCTDDNGAVYFAGPRKTMVLANVDPLLRSHEDEDAGGRVVAPMHGRIVEIVVSAGDRVRKGQKLAVLEAMKMQHEIQASIDGHVKDVHAQADQQIATDDLILELEPDNEDAS